MRGLLVKDFKLLLGQRNFLISMLFIAAVLAMTGQESGFIVGYVTMLSVWFTISTISYDEYNNGFAFLFTLPVSRKGYVAEKYLFALLAGGAGWALSAAAGAGVWAVRREGDPLEWLAQAIVIFLVMELFGALFIPLQLKFGQEKSRMVMGGFMGVVFALVFSLSAWLPDGMRSAMPSAMTGRAPSGIAPGLGFGWLSGIAMGLVLYAAVMALSVFLSIRIVAKKQF